MNSSNKALGPGDEAPLLPPLPSATFRLHIERRPEQSSAFGLHGLGLSCAVSLSSLPGWMIEVRPPIPLNADRS